MPPSQSNDDSILQNTRNIDIILIRLTSVEAGVHELQDKLKMYVPARENELQLKSIFEIVQRIENDVKDAKTKLAEVNEKVNTIDRSAEKRESSFQIKVMGTILSLIIGAAISIFVGYVTHVFH